MGNYLIARPAARNSAKSTSAEADIPLDAAVVLGVIARERISAVTATTGQSWWPMQITLTDGHTLELEARGDVPSITDAFS